MTSLLWGPFSYLLESIQHYWAGKLLVSSKMIVKYDDDPHLYDDDNDDDDDDGSDDLHFILILMNL